MTSNHGRAIWASASFQSRLRSSRISGWWGFSQSSFFAPQWRHSVVPDSFAVILICADLSLSFLSCRALANSRPVKKFIATSCWYRAAASELGCMLLKRPIYLWHFWFNKFDFVFLRISSNPIFDSESKILSVNLSKILSFASFLLFIPRIRTQTIVFRVTEPGASMLGGGMSH